MLKWRIKILPLIMKEKTCILHYLSNRIFLKKSYKKNKQSYKNCRKCLDKQNSTLIKRKLLK
jgi:hypothetical protein